MEEISLGNFAEEGSRRRQRVVAVKGRLKASSHIARVLAELRLSAKAEFAELSSTTFAVRRTAHPRWKSTSSVPAPASCHSVRGGMQSPSLSPSPEKYSD